MTGLKASGLSICYQFVFCLLAFFSIDLSSKASHSELSFRFNATGSVSEKGTKVEGLRGGAVSCDQLHFHQTA